MVNLKILEKQEDKLRLSRWEEIKTVREDINEMEIKRVIQGICTRKSEFFKKKKTTKPMETKEREKTQMNKVRDKRRDITISTTEILKIIREYFGYSYTNKLGNV